MFYFPPSGPRCDKCHAALGTMIFSGAIAVSTGLITVALGSMFGVTGAYLACAITTPITGGVCITSILILIGSGVYAYKHKCTYVGGQLHAHIGGNATPVAPHNQPQIDPETEPGK